jgi:hypothetical protein
MTTAGKGGLLVQRNSLMASTVSFDTQNTYAMLDTDDYWYLTQFKNWKRQQRKLELYL